MLRDARFPVKRNSATIFHMASIYRPRGRKLYYIAFRDPGTKRRVVVPGYVDRDATRAKATDLERQAARRAAGIEPPERVLPSVADHVASLRALGRDPTWCTTVQQRIAKVKAAVPSLDPQAVAAWIARNCGAKQTAKQYRGIMSAYLGVKIADAGSCGTAPRPARRSLTHDEARRLLAASPPYRRIVYLVAMTTGLRRSELRRLQWGDVRDSHIVLRAAATKSRRADVVPLRPDVAASLGPRGEDSARVFPRVPRSDTLRLDLKAAGIERLADFHSLRYTFCTWLALAGVTIYEAMALMRHRDVKLTTRVYLDAGVLETRAAVSRLPALTSALTDTQLPSAEVAELADALDSGSKFLASSAEEPDPQKPASRSTPPSR